MFLNGKVDDMVGSCSAFLKAAEIEDPELDEVSRMAFYVNRDRELLNRMGPNAA